MSFRGRGHGRGRGGFGGGHRFAKQVPFELFPEIEELGTANVSVDNKLVKWSWQLQKDRESSPYYYEDRRERPIKKQKVDIERYSDRKLQAKDDKLPLWHFIKLSSDYMPGELADDKKRHAKKVKWTSGSDMNKLDYLEKLEQKHSEKSETDKKEKKEDDDEDDEPGEEEDDGEYSDEGDYEQNEYVDDDEDDFNMPEDNDADEAFY